ncbi:terpenoid synthase [Xylona heveae TC161]|uniref:Bifunctional lycopene cyclase/phytoene synthase n=1 Tax=Xylona heveae (strain CBS 132557 / TC161) TaxID=1328760 RepID=A0A165AH40_XYLHT|nr:terpenoid synthase [Xylona heveae TC161]KZF20461.1 terpenoid synthase [Xylona heveae TC161]
MGYDYLLVHLKYTIPPAILLTLVTRPLLTLLDVYKIIFLILVALISTIPWDSYLIRAGIWTYPASVILGPTLFDIPAEEIFFFVIQTYSTSLLYILLSKPVFFPVYLPGRQDRDRERGILLLSWRTLGQVVLVCTFAASCGLIYRGGRGTYLGLIIAWAVPFLLLLWSLGYQFILRLSLLNTLVPVLVPTFYLWIIDTIELKRGTWVIESGTKLDLTLWTGLEIEEATFFLITNTMIVFGLIAFDTAETILETFPSLFPNVGKVPSPTELVKALTTPTSVYDQSRINGLLAASRVLKKHSRSFHIASCVFPGRLRIDLIILYAICRIADDLIDSAASHAEAEHWISSLKLYFELSFNNEPSSKAALKDFVSSTFPAPVQSTLLLLPRDVLSELPFYELLHGFEIDSSFSKGRGSWPIRTDAELDVYAQCVAGSVGELCLQLVFSHSTFHGSEKDKSRLIEAGRKMGTALQFINIARDIRTDAYIGRVYIPTSWLKEAQLRPFDVLENPDHACMKILRRKLIMEGLERYYESRHAIEELPAETRGPVRVAVESYVEIGRVLLESDGKLRAGKATVPFLRRLKVVCRSLVWS